MTLFKHNSYTCILILAMFFSLYSASIKAETLLYSSLFVSADKNYPSQKLLKAQRLQQQVKTTSGLKQAVAAILLATHHYDNGDYANSLIYSEQAIAFFRPLEHPVELANSYYIRAMTISIGQAKYEQAVDIFKQVLSVTNGDNRPQLQLLHTKANQKLGSLLMFLQKGELAHQYITKAIEGAQSSKNVELEIQAKLDLAKYYLSRNQLTQGEETLLSTHKLAINGQSKYLRRVLIQISRYYRKNKHFELAIKYGEKALQTVKNNKNTNELAWTYNNLAIAYEESGDENLALVHYLNALQHATTDTLFAALAQHNIGLIHYKQKNYPHAQRYLTQANTFFKKIEHSFYLMQSNVSLGQLYVKQQKFEQAIIALRQTLTAAKARKDNEVIGIAHKNIALAYAAIGDFKAANQHNKMSNKLLQRQVDQLTIQHQQAIAPQIDLAALQQNLLERTNDLAKANIEIDANMTNESRLNAIVALIALSLIIIVCLWWRQAKKQSDALIAFQRDQDSGLVNIHNEATLLAQLNQHFVSKHYLVALRLPSISKLSGVLNVELARKYHAQWRIALKQEFDSALFSIDEATLLFPLAKPTVQDSQLFEQTLDAISRCAPQVIQQLVTTDLTPKLGIAPLQAFKSSPCLNEGMNILNLAMTVLAGIDSVSNATRPRWLLGRPIEQQQCSMFAFATRQQWVYSIENKLIKLESDRQITIDWDKIKLQGQER